MSEQTLTTEQKRAQRIAQLRASSKKRKPNKRKFIAKNGTANFFLGVSWSRRFSKALMKQADNAS